MAIKTVSLDDDDEIRKAQMAQWQATMGGYPLAGTNPQTPKVDDPSKVSSGNKVSATGSVSGIETPAPVKATQALANLEGGRGTKKPHGAKGPKDPDNNDDDPEAAELQELIAQGNAIGNDDNSNIVPGTVSTVSDIEPPIKTS